jgi:ubiquinone/menaquinone biosynthesis C-methylase UbiE
MDETRSYSARYNPNDQELALSGAMRPADDAALAPLRACLAEAAAAAAGTLYINTRRLRYMSARAFYELARLLADLAEARPGLAITVVTSSVVPWAERRFSALAGLSPAIRVERYDDAFYPGQGVIENDRLIPVLRAQTSVLWGHEKGLLVKHGMRPGLKVADICSGLGDFAVLVYKEFKPELMVAVDHSRPFLDYAHRVAREFGAGEIRYQYGDAAELFLEDGAFDFVTSRLALQIFNEPQKILGELLRVCRPGGRVYVTNELMGHIHGYPRQEEIAWAYDLIPRMAATLGMDVNFGPKARAYLSDLGFEDIKVDLLEVNNLNTDVEDLARVAEGWIEFVTNEVAAATNQPEDVRARLRGALADYLYAVKNRRGFASWPIYVASGRKPARAAR